MMARGPVGAELKRMRLLARARSRPSDGRFTTDTSESPGRRTAMVVEPPPSMFSAWTAPRESISSASSSRSTPVLYPGWRPSTVASTRSPAAVMPSAVRGWSWSADVGRGEMDVSPSRTMSSRPPTASRTLSHPGVIERVSGSGLPGVSASSDDPAGPFSTTVSGAIGMPPVAGRTSSTTACCVPVGLSGSATPASTTSVPPTSSGVAGPKRGVYSTKPWLVLPWLTRSIDRIVPSGQVR